MPSHICKKCGAPFPTTRSEQQFCSEICRGQSNRSTDEQYAKIDGNLNLYLNRLLYKHNNIPGKLLKNLTRDLLLEIWNKQEGRCAISNMPMTCRAKKGEKFPYNASIDCIIPISRGGSYDAGNIHLVCTALNALMRDFPKEDFIKLCQGVAETQNKKDASTAV